MGLARIRLARDIEAKLQKARKVNRCSLVAEANRRLAESFEGQALADEMKRILTPPQFGSLDPHKFP